MPCGAGSGALPSLSPWAQVAELRWTCPDKSLENLQRSSHNAQALCSAASRAARFHLRLPVSLLVADGLGARKYEGTCRYSYCAANLFAPVLGARIVSPSGPGETARRRREEGAACLQQLLDCWFALSLPRQNLSPSGRREFECKTRFNQDAAAATCTVHFVPPPSFSPARTRNVVVFLGGGRRRAGRPTIPDVVAGFGLCAGPDVVVAEDECRW